jgi:TolB-like protein/class 3 adenylate cyclase
VAVETNRAPAQPDLQPQIAHLLLIDVVGYSKLLVNEQIELLQELNHAVRAAESFRAAEAKEKLIRIATGDGVALLFFENPEEPVRCALEIAAALKTQSPEIRVRMGIHSGPVNQVTDVNDRVNIAGAGINIAQRVLDCGDAGHILVSKHVADDLMQYRQWHPHLQDLGECEVKHGLRLQIFNLCKDDLGNPRLPEKLAPAKRGKRATASLRPVSTRRPAMPWIAIGLCAVALAVTMSILWPRLFVRHDVVATSEGALVVPEKSIAVLPFENFSDDQQNVYFAGGVQDEILTNLAKVADLKVISRTSTLQYKSSGGNARRNVREIAQQLGVANILEGTVQRVGDHVRVSAQLIDARTDAHLWGEHYDRDVADVFAVESEVAQKIVATLRAKLSPGEKAAIEEHSTTDLIAFELYQRAKDLIDGVGVRANQKEELFEGVGLLHKAVARDATFVRAYCYLARAHDLIYFLGFDHTAARLKLADRAAESARNLRPDSGEAHLALAQHFYYGFRDYERARSELAVARQLLPNEPLLFRLAAYIDRRQGRWDESIRNMERAAELDPRDVSILQQLSFTYNELHRFKETRETLDRILAITPDDIGAQLSKGDLDFTSRGDATVLHRTIESLLRKDPSVAEKISGAAFQLALREHNARAAQEALRNLSSDGCGYSGMPFPRAWCEGLAARMSGNNAEAHAAFTRARSEVEQILRVQPDYAEAFSVLGLIDAALGNKKIAIAESRRGTELCPASKDALQGVLLLQHLAITYAWTGEKELAIRELENLIHLPYGPSYGDLHAHPYFEPLRGDPRFDKLVRSLAPKSQP